MTEFELSQNERIIDLLWDIRSELRQIKEAENIFFNSIYVKEGEQK